MMTRNELLAALPGLTDTALDALTRAGIVRPVQSEAGPRFRPIDAARLTLAMELEDAYDLDADALALVLSLIDQVHGLRGDTSIADRARFDNYYIENWSLWLDIKIMMRTLSSVVRGSGG